MAKKELVNSLGHNVMCGAEASRKAVGGGGDVSSVIVEFRGWLAMWPNRSSRHLYEK